MEEQVHNKQNRSC